MKFVLDPYDDAQLAPGRDAAVETNTEESLTQQHFSADADLNAVLKRFGITDGAKLPSQLDWGTDTMAQDFTGAPDFRAAQDLILAAREQFMLLPAELRARWNNDPGYMMDWVHDPKNITEATALGFFKHPEEAAAPPAPLTQ